MTYNKHYLIASFIIVALVLVSINTYSSTGFVTSITDLNGNNGVLKLTSLPSSARIFIDNVNQGTTPKTLNLLQGSYKLELKKDGYRNYTTAITVTRRQTLIKNIQLEQTEQTPPIQVITTPNNANVYLDNNLLTGVTPLTITDVLAGQHTIRMRKQGYTTETRTITLNPGIPAIVNVSTPAIVNVSLSHLPNFEVIFQNPRQFSVTDSWNYSITFWNSSNNDYSESNNYGEELHSVGTVHPASENITKVLQLSRFSHSFYFIDRLSSVDGVGTPSMVGSEINTSFFINNDSTKIRMTVVITSITNASGKYIIQNFQKTSVPI